MKRIDTGKWCTSRDGELYNPDDYDTKEEAIEGGKRDYEYTTFYVGKVTALEFDETDVSLSDDAFECLANQLSEECGEVGETWDTTKEQMEELEIMLSKTVIEWVNKNDLHPRCFGINEDCEIELEEEK